MKGVTLIETIVMISIFALITGVIGGSILLIYKVHGFAWEESLAIEEARRGVETMVKELRQATQSDGGDYAISEAGDKNITFYSDIDGDGVVEKVRYFLGTVVTGSNATTCQTAANGGTCSVTFNNFLQGGTLNSAQVRISVAGDLDRGTSGREYVDVSADGVRLGTLCASGCTHCPASTTWEGTITFDSTTTNQAGDGSVTFLAAAASSVGNECNQGLGNHSMRAKFEFSYNVFLMGVGNELKKGVTKPTGSPPVYLPENEKVSTITSYVRNAPPIFEYYDATGTKIVDYPAKLKDVRLIKVDLVVNVNPNRPPSEFTLESFVELRNLKGD